MEKLDKLNIQLIALNEQLKISKQTTTNIEGLINGIQYRMDAIETEIMKAAQTKNDK